MFRVLQGFIDTAGQARRYAIALRLGGHKAFSWVYESPFPEEKCDRLINLSRSGFWNGRMRKISYLVQIILRFSVLHIHKGFTILENGKDLWLFKKFGKIVVIHYRGSELRKIMNQTDINFKLKLKIAQIDRLADAILVKDGQLAELLRPYVGSVTVFPNIVDVGSLKEEGKEKAKQKKLKVVHIPTNPEKKGSLLIRQVAFETRDFVDYRELSNIPRKQVIQEMLEADVIVDQILTGTFGNVALEAMAVGTPVIARLDPRFASYEPEVPPIINADDRTMGRVFIELANNRDILKEYGKKGRRFVEKYHSYEVVGKKLESLYSLLKKRRVEKGWVKRDRRGMSETGEGGE